MRLILIRHGETTANLEMRWSGSKDLDITNLTQQGRKQAEQLGRWFKDRRFQPTHAYTSPQTRAKETANLAGGHWALPIAEINDLRETGAGIFEGKTWSEIEKEYPKQAELFRDSRDWAHIPGAEQEDDRRQRGKEVFLSILKNHSNTDIVVMFAHAGIIQHTISAILQSPKLWSIPMKNTAIFEFSIDTEAWNEKSRVQLNPTLWKITRFNEQPHLV